MTTQDHWGWIEILLLDLQRHGFRIGVDQHRRVRELLVLLAEAGELPDDTRRLAGFLGPILCTTPSQQAYFLERCEEWAALFAAAPLPLTPVRPSPVPAPPPATGGLQSVMEAAAGASIRGRGWAILASAVAVVAIGALWVIPSGEPTPVGAEGLTVVQPVEAPVPPAPGVDPVPPVAEDPVVAPSGTSGTSWVPIALPLAALAGWLSWRAATRSASRAFLNRRADPGGSKVHTLLTTVRGGSPALAGEVRGHARELRPYRLVAGGDVDIPSTVRAAANWGGWVDPVAAARRQRIEYVALVDQVSATDQEARLAQALLEGLVREGVYVAWYQTQVGTTTVRSGGRTASLAQLTARHRDHVLWVWAAADRLISPVTGRLRPWTEVLARWPERRVVTREGPGAWGWAHQQLRAAGFRVAEASPAGLARVEAVSQQAAARLVGSGAIPLPAVFRDDMRRWTGPVSPGRREVDDALEALRGYLGPEGFRWLGGCAVYPELRWEITLLLGDALLDEAGRPVLTLDRLRRLVSLPWFRIGMVPDWFREELLATLPPSDAGHLRTRLQEILLGALDGMPASLALQVATDDRPALRRIWDGFAGRRDLAPELRDRVFLDFMGGRLAMPVPRRVAEILRGDPREDPARRSVSIATTVAVWIGVAAGSLLPELAGSPGFWSSVLPFVVIGAPLSWWGWSRAGSVRRRVSSTACETLGLLFGAGVARTPESWVLLVIVLGLVLMVIGGVPLLPWRSGTSVNAGGPAPPVQGPPEAAA